RSVQRSNWCPHIQHGPGLRRPPPLRGRPRSAREGSRAHGAVFFLRLTRLDVFLRSVPGQTDERASMSSRWSGFFLTLCVALTAGRVMAAGPPLTAQVVATGLTKPLLVTHAPGDFSRIFIVEQNGKIKIVKNGVLLSTPFLDVGPLMGGSEAYLEYGLLGLAFHPMYKLNGMFYVMYTVGNSTLADPVIYRYHVSANPDEADPASA